MAGRSSAEHIDIRPSQSRLTGSTGKMATETKAGRWRMGNTWPHPGHSSPDGDSSGLHNYQLCSTNDARRVRPTANDSARILHQQWSSNMTWERVWVARNPWLAKPLGSEAGTIQLMQCNGSEMVGRRQDFPTLIISILVIDEIGAVRCNLATQKVSKTTI